MYLSQSICHLLNVSQMEKGVGVSTQCDNGKWWGFGMEKLFVIVYWRERYLNFPSFWEMKKRNEVVLCTMNRIPIEYASFLPRWTDCINSRTTEESVGECGNSHNKIHIIIVMK